jgi:hypothetical protein
MMSSPQKIGVNTSMAGMFLLAIDYHDGMTTPLSDIMTRFMFIAYITTLIETSFMGAAADPFSGHTLITKQYTPEQMATNPAFQNWVLKQLWMQGTQVYLFFISTVRTLRTYPLNPASTACQKYIALRIPLFESPF